MEHSFKYKWEESDSITPSASQHEKTSTLIIWVAVFLAVISVLFISGYKEKLIPSEGRSLSKRQLQSLRSFGIDNFLVRTSSLSGKTVFTKMKVQLFVDDVRVQNEMLENKNKYKEHLIFFLSKANVEDILDAKRKIILEEKIKNHINSFLPKGKIQVIEIKGQPI